MIRIFVLAFVGCCVAAAAAQSSPADQKRAVEFLSKVIAGQNKLRYAGVRKVTLQVNGRLQSLTEYIVRDRNRSRTTFPDESPKRGHIIIEDGRQRLHYVPAMREVWRTPAMHDAALNQLRRMLQLAKDGKLYIGQFDGGTVANRPTVGIAIGDPNGFVPRKLWFDTETGLLIKSQVRGRGGALTGSFEFLRVDYNPEIRAEMFAWNNPNIPMHDEKPFVPPRWRLMVPSWLPSGFAPIGQGVRFVGRTPIYLAHFSDGRGHITIFQAQSVDAPRAMGARDSVRAVSGRKGRLTIIVAGNVESATLTKVLESLK